MKNKKGFTLIELLAIIVILAIIAVITVPIILNIIENSKKGAATDSAYGFKDAVNKAYVTKLSGDSDYEIPNNTYTVEQLKTQIDLSLSGKEPSSNSWVTIEKNNEPYISAQKVKDYFGYDDKTWIQNQFNTGLWHNASSQTITCMIDSSGVYCGGLGVGAYAYYSGSVYVRNANFRCSIYNDGSGVCRQE